MATSPRAASVSSSQPRRRIKADVTEKAAAESPYHLRISRLTVDKLGVKLYDKASAVVAELIANGYDADAETVTVRLPLGIQLASKAGGQLKDVGYVIDVEDDGHGMAPEEAIDFYLRVGADRRTRKGQDGSRSRNKKRPVMGRKGIGKLAPFGICRRIEVWSAGGPKTRYGYAVTHFFMDFDKIVTDDDEAVPLEVGDDDRTWSTKSGTRVRLTAFLAKRVPDLETFLRQLAVRFTFARPDFRCELLDFFLGEALRRLSDGDGSLRFWRSAIPKSRFLDVRSQGLAWFEGIAAARSNPVPTSDPCDRRWHGSPHYPS